MRAALIVVTCLALLHCGPASSPDAGPADASGDADASGIPPSDGFTPAPHPPFPVLPMRGQAQLVPPRIVIIVDPTEPLAPQLFAFGDALVTSQWYQAVSADYGLGTPTGGASVHVTGAAMAASMNFTGLRAYVQSTIAAHPAAAPDGNTVYVVFYPPGTSYPNACGDYGAHDVLAASGNDAVAYIQRCTPPPGQSQIDYLTSVASHEILEAATDSVPPGGFAMPDKLRVLSDPLPPWSISSWAYAQQGGVENGDLCEGTIATENGVAYQRIWSIAAAAAGNDPCVPPLSEPYYSVSAAQDWIEIPAGTTTTIPITGWSTAPRADWWVVLRGSAWDPSGFSASLAGGATMAMVNNGTPVMVSITAPPTPGEFAVYRVLSSAAAPVALSGGGTVIPQPATGDQFHMWVFGVHTRCASCTVSSTCGDGTCDTAAHETCANCPDDCGACGAICGAANLGTTCSTGTSCPTNATCTASGSCACNTGFVASTCEGAACPAGGCTSPDFWCTPAACGQANFDAPCGRGTCPSGAVCTATDRCQCGPGTYAATCDGQPCPSTGCAFPNYWCTTCGSTNFTVTCPSGGACPSFAACDTGGGCSCLPGYQAVSCGGESCAQTRCSHPDWWCVPAI